MKVFIIGAMVIVLAALSSFGGGCYTPGLIYEHLEGMWSDGENFFSMPAHLLIYDWDTAQTSGRVDTLRGTGCRSYQDNILPWSTGAYVSYSFGNYAKCTTLQACPSSLDTIVLAAYSQVNHDTPDHYTRWLVDSVNYRSPFWNFDASNSNGQTNAFLAPLTVVSVNNFVGTCSPADPCSFDVVVNVPFPTGLYGYLQYDDLNSPDSVLAGVEVMFTQSPYAPVSGLESLWSPIADPENDQLVARSELGAGRTSGAIHIADITSADAIYFSYRPILSHQGACAAFICAKDEMLDLRDRGFALGFVTANSDPVSPEAGIFEAFRGSFADSRHVDLLWETARENNVAGFMVYRSRNMIRWVQVNSDLISAQSGGSSGSLYAYTDALGFPVYRTTYYAIVAVDANMDEMEEIVTTVIP